MHRSAVQAELQAILHHESLARSGILILANKQDLKDAMSVEDLSVALGLTGIRDHPWHIQPTCALRCDSRALISMVIMTSLAVPRRAHAACEGT